MEKIVNKSRPFGSDVLRREEDTPNLFVESYDLPEIAKDHAQEDDEGSATDKSSPPREE